LEEASRRPFVIAVDTSSLVAYLSGTIGNDVSAVETALTERQVCLPPVVLTELLGAPKLPAAVLTLFRQLPVLAVSEGYWERAGALRSLIISRRRRAPLADALIAQSCLDHDVPLITRDTDFRAFVRLGGLKLLV
jgi:predicted nucleic acid-binding protein